MAAPGSDQANDHTAIIKLTDTGYVLGVGNINTSQHTHEYKVQNKQSRCHFKGKADAVSLSSGENLPQSL